MVVTLEVEVVPSYFTARRRLAEVTEAIEGRQLSEGGCNAECVTLQTTMDTEMGASSSTIAFAACDGTCSTVTYTAYYDSAEAAAAASAYFDATSLAAAILAATGLWASNIGFAGSSYVSDDSGSDDSSSSLFPITADVSLTSTSWSTTAQVRTRDGCLPACTHA